MEVRLGLTNLMEDGGCQDGEENGSRELGEGSTRKSKEGPKCMRMI